VIALVKRTRISAPAERVWRFFRELDERYADSPIGERECEEGENLARLLGADTEGA
jgi:hypothetical protein